MTTFDYLKNIFFVLIILQILPSLVEGLRKQYGNYFESKSQVGVIKIDKVIYDSNPYIKQLQTFFKNSDIKAIVLQIDSSGSASGSGQALHDEILMLKKEYLKPIFTKIENTCASGAYWTAAATDYIIAPGTALVGSIGATFSHLFQLKDFLNNYKISTIALKAGTYKGAGDPFVETTAIEQAMLQGVLDNSYEQFVQSIAEARKLSIASADQWADGKIFTGQQALKLGLIDELGSTHALIKIIKERALVEGEIEWIYHQEPHGFLSSLFGQSEDGSFFKSCLTNVYTFVEQRILAIK